MYFLHSMMILTLHFVYFIKVILIYIYNVCSITSLNKHNVILFLENYLFILKTDKSNQFS